MMTMPHPTIHSIPQISFHTCSPHFIQIPQRQPHSQRAFPSPRFANLPTHKKLQVMPAPGTLAHAAHPVPTFTAANVDCNAGTSTALVMPLMVRALCYSTRVSSSKTLAIDQV